MDTPLQHDQPNTWRAPANLAPLRRRSQIAPVALGIEAMDPIANRSDSILAGLQDAEATLLLESERELRQLVGKEREPSALEGSFQQWSPHHDIDDIETFDEMAISSFQKELQSSNCVTLKVGADFAGYTLRELLGAGAFGVVYRAVKGNQVVALKILKEEVESLELLARFEREAKVLAQLNHPNIVRVHDFGVAHDRPFIALEYLKGESLQQLMKSENRPDSEEARRIMAAVAAGLTHCHGKGIVHRDLKPANIIIEEGTGRPVLVDFGLVYKDDRRKKSPKLEGFTQNLSIKGMIKGTPQFMAPEQAFPHDFGAIGAASDVWAFGATLYYLLTGELLFPGLKALEILEPLAQGRVPKVQAEHPDMSKRLAQIIQHCLQQASIHRPTMQELELSLNGPKEKFAVRSSVKVLSIAKKNKPNWIYRGLMIILIPLSVGVVAQICYVIS